MTRPNLIISQRVEYVSHRDELRDALDLRLTRFFWELGFTPIPICSSIEQHDAYLTELSPAALVLSGGNNIGENEGRDRMELSAIEFSIANKIPVLGICRGMQIINKYFGGKIREVTKHAATTHSIFGPITNQESYHVNSFHDFGMIEADLGSSLHAVAWSDDGIVEALRHDKLPILGIMWHPERNANFDDVDIQIIKGHFKDLLCRL